MSLLNVNFAKNFRRWWPLTCSAQPAGRKKK